MKLTISLFAFAVFFGVLQFQEERKAKKLQRTKEVVNEHIRLTSNNSKVFKKDYRLD